MCASNSRKAAIKGFTLKTREAGPGSVNSRQRTPCECATLIWARLTRHFGFTLSESTRPDSRGRPSPPTLYEHSLRWTREYSKTTPNRFDWPTIDESHDRQGKSGPMLAPIPNPTSGAVAMSFELPAPARVTAQIFSVDGRLIRTLAEGVEFGAGLRTLSWDGRGAAHERLFGGIYFERVRAGAESDVRKILIMP